MFVQKHFGKSLQHSLIQSHEAFAFLVASRPLAVSSLISGVGEDISLSRIKKWPLRRMHQIFRPFSIAILKERTLALPQRQAPVHLAWVSGCGSVVVFPAG